MSAYSQGFAAFEIGLSVDDNPYPVMSPLWHDWMDGYDDAEDHFFFG